MYGWRGRIGLVLPSRGDTLIYEFYQVVPAGVVVTPYILNLTDLVSDELHRVRAEYERAVQALHRERVDAICVCGTPPLVVDGPDACDALASGLRSLTSIPLITGIEAEMRAMRACGVRRVCLATPHEEPLNVRLRRMLEDRGTAVPHAAGLGIRAAFEISLVAETDVYRHARRAWRESAGACDGIHLTCPRWPTLLQIDPLERDCGCPVTSSAQALIWNGLGLLGLRPREGAWGSLFGHRPEDVAA